MYQVLYRVIVQQFNHAPGSHLRKEVYFHPPFVVEFRTLQDLFKQIIWSPYWSSRQWEYAQILSVDLSGWEEKNTHIEITSQRWYELLHRPLKPKEEVEKLFWECLSKGKNFKILTSTSTTTGFHMPGNLGLFIIYPYHVFNPYP